MIHIGIKEWVRRKHRNQAYEEASTLQKDKKNDRSMEVKITQNLENLKRNYFDQSNNQPPFLSPEKTWARLEQNCNYANGLGEELSTKQPEVFRKKMKEHCGGLISLAEYQYYWIMIEKAAIEGIQNKAIVEEIQNKAVIEEIEKSLAIRKSIFQLCMTNQIENLPFNERAFEEVIGRISYRHYQIDHSLFIEKKETLHFAAENNVKEEWETCSEIAARHSFMKDEKRSHGSPTATDNSQESRNDERIGARVFQKKFFSQLVHNKKMKEKNTYQKKVQKARNWYIYSR